MVSEETILIPLRLIISLKQIIKVLQIRVRVILTPSTLDIGFTSKLLMIIWVIFGGFLLHIMMSNYLAILMKPSYNKPIDTLDDLYERDHNIRIFFPAASTNCQNYLRSFKNIRFTRLAHRCIEEYDLTADVDRSQYDKHIRDTIDKNDRVVLTYKLEEKHRLHGFWYKGSEELR